MLNRVSAVIGTLVLFAGCDRGASSPMTTAPTSLTAQAAATSSTSTTPFRAGGDVSVGMHDNCDAETFNAALGAGTCVGKGGGLQYDRFLEQLGRLGIVGAWHFSPMMAHIAVGQRFRVLNLGGEEHTFTEVDAFGGGIMPSLNQLAGLPTVAPECLALEDEDRVAPGALYIEEITEPGPLKVQCCIHPWMRLEAEVAR
jgi:hypothetical protein